MAYIVITNSDGTELGRRELRDLVIVGRSPDCDLRIHDIMLSREHCGLEPGDGGWVVVDLDSRNGTYVNNERVTRRKLCDGDRLDVGRTTIDFYTGPMPKAGARPDGLLERPADPFEALANTLVDYEFNPQFEPPIERPIIRPKPRPMPVASRNPVGGGGGGMGTAGGRSPAAAAAAVAMSVAASAMASAVAAPVAHGEREDTGSSPTWATRPVVLREAGGRIAAAVAEAPVAAPVPVPAPVPEAMAALPELAEAEPMLASVPDRSRLRGRVGRLLLETLATAAAVGVTVLGLLTYLG